MANPKRSDGATAGDCDWSFTERSDVMAAIGGQAKRAAEIWGLDVDDVSQEMYLWLAVRPELLALDAKLIARHVRQVGQKLGERERRREADPLPGAEGCDG